MKKHIFLYSFLPAILLAGIFGVKTLKISAVASGNLIKASLPAVYYLGADGKRYVFPNDKIYFSWYADFSGVKTISDAELASYQLGGNVTYRPGTRLVKIQSDPRVYAVGVGGVLRWVGSESAAVAIFGNDWSGKIDDLADAFFINYKIGAPITSSGDYNPSAESAADGSINVDKGLSADTNTNANANANTNGNLNANINANANVNQPLVCSTECGLGSVCTGANICTALPVFSTMTVRVIDVDYSDLCFVGDACMSGNCCSLGGLSFEKNDNYRAVAKRDLYLYGDKQQLCDRPLINTSTKNDINNALSSFSDSVAATTGGRLAVGTLQSHVSGQIPMSRIEGGCDWWFAPSNLSPLVATQLDSSTDAVFVIAPRTIVAGTIPGPTVKNFGPGNGLAGAGYYYIAADAPTATGKNFSSLFTDALVATQNLSYSAGLFDASKAIVGNHCRDNKKDFDETGVDCGGSECGVCY